MYTSIHSSPFPGLRFWECFCSSTLYNFFDAFASGAHDCCPGKYIVIIEDGNDLLERFAFESQRVCSFASDCGCRSQLATKLRAWKWQQENGEMRGLTVRQRTTTLKLKKNIKLIAPSNCYRNWNEHGVNQMAIQSYYQATADMPCENE